MIGKKQILKPDQIAKISAAVAKAESGTSGEIVPMIVGRSSVIGHLPLYAGFIFFSIAAVVSIEVRPYWLFLWWGLPLAILLLGCIVAGYIVTRFDSVQRWLIPSSDEESQVWNRASAEWALNQVKKTKNRTGILLFVSVMERKAIILADEGVAKHYPQETWQAVVEGLTDHLKKGDWTEGFETAIQRCGEILKMHLPAGSSDVNEISNRIIIKD